MNQAELELYEKHRKFFREKMGALVEGDHVALKFDAKTYDIGFVTQTKTMEKDIISADLIYVRWYSDKPWRDQSCDKREWAEEHFIPLPLPIDRDNPERGLWGMVDWDHCRIVTDDIGDVEQVLMWTWFNGTEKEHESMPLTLALLRAIDAQEAK